MLVMLPVGDIDMVLYMVMLLGFLVSMCECPIGEALSEVKYDKLFVRFVLICAISRKATAIPFEHRENVFKSCLPFNFKNCFFFSFAP